MKSSKYGRKYDWSDLEELAKQHTPKEIAKIKGCKVETARLALTQMGIKAQLSEYEKHLIEKRKSGAEASRAARISKKLKCSECGEPLTIIPWNRVTEMAFCTNIECKLCHAPIMDGSLKLREEVYIV